MGFVFHTKVGLWYVDASVHYELSLSVGFCVFEDIRKTWKTKPSFPPFSIDVLTEPYCMTIRLYIPLKYMYVYVCLHTSNEHLRSIAGRMRHR